MPSFTSEQLIAASELRSISQRHLFGTLEQHGKLGILSKDHLEAVMLPHQRYVMMLNRIKELEEKLENMKET